LSLKRLTKESLIYGLSGYISKMISVFLLPLYTAVLTPKDYGILDLLGTIGVVSTFLIVSGTDTAQGYYFFRLEYKNERPGIISSALFLRVCFGLIAFILIVIFSKLISITLFGQDLSLFVIITGGTVAFSTIHQFLFDLLRLEFRQWLYLIISSSYITVSISLMVLFVLIFKMGVYGVLLGQAISYGLIFVFTIGYVIKRYGRQLSFKWIKKILSYGFPLIGTGVAIWILNSSSSYFLAHYADLSAVGIYAVGLKIASFLGIIAGALQLAWGPYAMDIQYNPEAKNIYSKVFQIYFFVNIIGIFLVSLFAINILKVFTQPNYYDAKAVVPFLCFSTVFSSAYFIVAIGINIVKRVQHTIWIMFCGAAVNITLNYFLTPHIGGVGAAFSIMTSNFTIFILTMIVSQKYYYVPYKFNKILLVLIPAAILIFVSYYYNLGIAYRIIIAVIATTYFVIFLYNNFKNADEFIKLIQFAKELNIFSKNHSKRE
jgi:O-antigen/teichoic acid export membrane protein